MMQPITLTIEYLPEQVYVITSPQVQGLVAQSNTVEEGIQSALELARILLKEQKSPRAVRRPALPKRQRLVVNV
ncbi:MAG: hypothetical protein OXI53_12280 [Nitrospira sp.]|nr:hypothetical protein [Nitrospira sp.]MDE0487542.1 hypothetical protein [Nitrospira sp.]